MSKLGARFGVPEFLCYERIGSTLDVVHACAAAGSPHGTVALADEQVAGRGRRGQRWHSPRGAGIWLGYLHRVAAPPATGLLSVRVGLAAIRAVRVLGVDARLKWPNDILVRGRKLAGVLCEGRADSNRIWVAIGIGMNVYGPLPDEVHATATSLDQHADATRLDVLERLLPGLRALPVSNVLAEAERAALSTVDWLRDRRLRSPVAGVAAGIADDGALLVETPTGVERLVAGTVVLAGDG